MKKWLPWLLLLVMAAWLVSSLIPRPESGFQVRAFGKLPVLLNGRIQPLDSVGRNSLLQIRARQSVAWKENGRWQTLSGAEWLLETMAKPELADTRRIFRVDNVELISLLKLAEDQKYYAFNEIQPQLDELAKQAERVQEIESARRTVFEQQLMRLYNGVMMFQRLKLSLKPRDTDDFAAELREFEQVIPAGMAAVREREAGKAYDQAAFDKLVQFMSGYEMLSRFALPLVIPTAHTKEDRENWSNMGNALLASIRAGSVPQPAHSYAAMISAYRSGAVEAFNTAVADYHGWLAQNYAPEQAKGGREYFYNTLQAFYHAMVIYVLALILALAYWMLGSEVWRRSAVLLIGLALAVHTIGLVFRMVLEARPPVTNLYSSAIFIGWGSVILGLVLERIFRDGIGCVVAAAVGFITLIVAHNLALGGDTMEMMRAVLDTNFWLATHVVVITLGYSAMFVAGFLAIIYILRGVFTSSLSATTAKALERMVYGIICFATLFSFAGTVLGGIWADQSWGRFWGWDPKENGALMIVIWCAVMLHARWGRLVRERGMMNMAIVGNIITSFSWFGVNMLGIGLHSYGFMDAAFKWLMLFTGSQLAIIALGSLPLSVWKSSRAAVSSPDEPGDPSGKTEPAPSAP